MVIIDDAKIGEHMFATNKNIINNTFKRISYGFNMVWFLDQTNMIKSYCLLGVYLGEEVNKHMGNSKCTSYVFYENKEQLHQSEKNEAIVSKVTQPPTLPACIQIN